MDKKIRVLVVDDSAFMRKMISKLLGQDPGLEVAATARDGMEAVRKMQEVKPDVVTLDIEMPKLDGLQTLGYIMSECPTPCVMLSAFTPKGAQTTLRALEYGAVDFVQKPSGSISLNLEDVQNELISKIKVAHSIDLKTLSFLELPAARPAVGAPAPPPASRHRCAVIIGCSTGGPRALTELIPRLPGNLGCPVLVVQHMSSGFTASLAERLDHSSQLRVKEAAEGDVLEAGRVYLAPGDFHMEVAQRNGKAVIHLNQDPPMLGVRPSVDVLFRSAAEVYGNGCLAVVLTGMGHDGSRGATAVRQRGGMVLAQDEASCVVFGMPRSVIEAGHASRVIPLAGMAGAIEDTVRSWI